MDQLFKLRNEKNWKSLLLTGNDILLVNKSYDSAEAFREKFNEKGLFKDRLEISILDISRISHPDWNNTVATITYPKKEDDAELELEFESELEQQQFIQAVSKPRSMMASRQEVGTFKAIASPLFGLGLTALFAFIVYSDARTLESGGYVETGGRRSLYKKLFAWLAEMLGTQGTIIAASAIGLLCAYFIYRNLQSKPVEVVYA
ncbi:MAG: hypothetical protein QM687_10020 [Ferruginibacter sp.]